MSLSLLEMKFRLHFVSISSLAHTGDCIQSERPPGQTGKQVTRKFCDEKTFDESVNTLDVRICEFLLFSRLKAAASKRSSSARTVKDAAIYLQDASDFIARRCYRSEETPRVGLRRFLRLPLCEI